MGISNTIQYHAQLLAWNEFAKKGLPGLLQKEMAEFMGSKFLIGPDGVMMDMAGQQVPPEQVLQQNGQPTIPQPQGFSGTMGTTPGDLQRMQAPGTVALPRMVG
jgi:hypothetical protein